MFTGLVSAVGEVRSIRTGPDGAEITIAAPFEGVTPGESIAVSGVCLTVTGRDAGWFAVHAVGPTLGRTRLGALEPGARVNLERAVRAGEPLGGHLVQGHVDGVGEVCSVRRTPDATLVDLRVPPEVWEVSVPLGSVTVDGVSLTVNRLPANGIIQVSLIPHTLRHTTLGQLEPGHRVHLEADLIGKYVRAFMTKGGGS